MTEFPTFEACVAWKAAAAAGDGAARGRLVAAHAGLAVYYARRLGRPAGDPEDAAQEAFAALLVAADRWDPAHGVPFAAYLARGVRRHFANLRRGGSRSVRAVRLGPDRKGRDRLQAEPDRPRADAAELAGRRELAGRALARLHPRPRTMVELYFGLDPRGPLLSREIARLFGISTARTSQILRRSLALMSHALPGAPTDARTLPPRPARRARDPRPGPREVEPLPPAASA